MEQLIAQLVIAVVTHVPDFVEAVLTIKRSTEMTEEEKTAAYAKLAVEYKKTVEDVKKAVL